MNQINITMKRCQHVFDLHQQNQGKIVGNYYRI